MLAEIEDRSACLAWSPLKTHADVIAIGTKDSGGGGFDDYGGELELHSLDVGGTAGPRALSSVKTAARFSSLGWSSLSGSPASSSKPLGLLAGGMSDGVVNLWNPASMLDPDATAEDHHVAAIKKHANGPVGGLQFNPHRASSHLLATGGADGKLLITSLDRPEAPSVFSPAEDPNAGHAGPATAVDWNSQVAHIVASAGGDGSCIVWDLRQKKPWCEMREAGRCALSAACWNPTEGLHIVTASSDDGSPDVKLWDLRASTTVPLGTMRGHSQGVLGAAWCPYDAGMLLTCGKDNRTLLWDLYKMESIYDIPNEDAGREPAEDARGMYGGLGSSQQKRYDVQWSPLLRGVASTCSFDRKVQCHSLNGAFTLSGRPPKWTQRPSGVAFGFGGQCVSFAADAPVLQVRKVVEDEPLAAASAEFDRALDSGDLRGLCASKSAAAATAHEAQVWSFLRILFEEDARAELLTHLGFDAKEIEEKAMKFASPASFDSDWSAVSDANAPENQRPAGTLCKKAEETVHRALLVGNFEAAVECCFRSGSPADALVLASCGGYELWSQAQARYFSTESARRPFLAIVKAVMDNSFESLVDAADLSRWRETLAVLSVYAKSDAFPVLCERLGQRLEEALDISAAALCYVFSRCLERAVGFWLSDLDHAPPEEGTLALQGFVEKVTVLSQACSTDACAVHPAVAEKFNDYAAKLAEQGRAEAATRYARVESPGAEMLRYRLYHITHNANVACHFPYPVKNVGVAPVQRQPQQQQQQPAQPSPAATGGYQQPAAGYQQPAAANYQQPAAASYQQQAAANYQQPAAANYQQPTAASYQQPAAANYQQPAAANYQQPAAASYQQPAAANYQQPAAASYQQPAYQQPAASNYQQPAEPAPSVQPTNKLPPDWVELIDPSSGAPYYCNQATGVTQWEHPAASPDRPAPPAYAQPQPGASPSPTEEPRGSPQNLMSKYGDGFVSSASNPALAQQYGNTGTSNPYAGANRPGTAAASVARLSQPRRDEPAPAEEKRTFTADDVPPEYRAAVGGLVDLLAALEQKPLGPAERKQVAEVHKGHAVLFAQLARGEVDPVVAGELVAMVEAIEGRDYGRAGAMQTKLANEFWKAHKDWLRGTKFLIQIASRRM